jgi:2-polyprenyl-3-methyl-5-hydroxy-6-metoxy-1,4-benzoquinol methylase
VWVRDAEGVETRAIAELVELNRKRVLDVGCGRGRLTEFAASRAAEVFAFDPDEEAIEDAQARLPAAVPSVVTFAVAGAEEFDAPRHPFDIALCGWSL